MIEISQAEYNYTLRRYNWAVKNEIIKDRFDIYKLISPRYVANLCNTMIQMPIPYELKTKMRRELKDGT